MAPKHHVTLSDAAEEFLHFRAARFASSTVVNQGYVLRRFAAFVTRDIQLRNLADSTVESLAQSLRAARDVIEPSLRRSVLHVVPEVNRTRRPK